MRLGEFDGLRVMVVMDCVTDGVSRGMSQVVMMYQLAPPLVTSSGEQKVEAECALLYSCLMIDWSSMASLMKHEIEKQRGAGSGERLSVLGQHEEEQGPGGRGQFFEVICFALSDTLFG